MTDIDKLIAELQGASRIRIEVAGASPSNIYARAADALEAQDKAIREALDVVRSSSVPLGVSEARHWDRLLAESRRILTAVLEQTPEPPTDSSAEEVSAEPDSLTVSEPLPLDPMPCIGVFSGLRSTWHGRDDWYEFKPRTGYEQDRARYEQTPEGSGR